VVDSDQTRSFLETAPAYAKTGWAMISTEKIGELKGLNIGVLTLVSGLDRIGLASFLRSAGAKVEIVRTPEELTAGLNSHKFDAGITEALLATKLASDQHWQAVWLPAELKRHGLVFGLWKGELTLKRAIDQAMLELIADGTVAKIITRYAGAPLN
jgi:polar amino acid transport system substrate-binding protein/cystine transport system substrate-binding protein/membrane-bound lytic murein transglycosylase F